MTSTGQDEPHWFKSSRSGGGDCVEVAFLSDAVLVRDSKDVGGPVLTFSHEEWRAFVADVRERPTFGV